MYLQIWRECGGCECSNFRSLDEHYVTNPEQNSVTELSNKAKLLHLVASMYVPVADNCVQLFGKIVVVV